MGNTFTVFVDPRFDLETRRSIGREIIRYVVDRTQDGRGIGGDKFGKYSKNYKESNEFKTAGKEGETKVNLTLTGEMLGSLELIDISIAGRIEIGFKDGSESDKSIWMAEKGYDFMGIDDNELSNILGDFETELLSLSDIVKDLVEVDEA